MIHLRNLICLTVLALGAAAMQCQHQSQRALTLPRIAGKYTTIYLPEADRFPGPDTSELKAGRRYAVWVPNDHTFIKGPDGRWNLFGITHPLTSPTPLAIHEGEFQSFHARAPVGELKDILATGAWKDLPKVLRASDRPGENPAFYAPDVIQKGDLYYMFYGPDPIRLATSPDLQTWTPQGPLFSDEPSARDPSVLFWQGVYSMVYCVENTVAIRTSTDLRRWSSQRTILRLSGNRSPESPTIVRHGGRFYLFVCIWSGLWDGKTVQGAYSHQTYVYQSDNLLDFSGGKQVTILDAHAPEVFQGEDGQWYISSAEWPRRGVSIAKLSWE
jgi:beta-fructofuranosidase